MMGRRRMGRRRVRSAIGGGGARGRDEQKRAALSVFLSTIAPRSLAF
jgi:hypothetical protein